MKFAAIDVETANANMASICSVGVALFEDGAIASEWYSLIDPRDYFDPVPIWTVPLKDDQVVGLADLARLGNDLFAALDPAASFRTTAPYKYQKKAGHYLLTLELPFVEREDVELAVASGDLIVTLGNFRHHIPIPRTLSGHVPTKAKVEAGRLTVRFEPAREEAGHG